MTVRVALIGCGLMGHAHMPGYQAAGGRADVVSCCDNDEARATKCAAALGSKAVVTTDWQARPGYKLIFPLSCGF